MTNMSAGVHICHDRASGVQFIGAQQSRLDS